MIKPKIAKKEADVNGIDKKKRGLINGLSMLYS